MSTMPMSGVTSYCSSKIFASYFGMGLNPEVKDKVDVIVYEPGGVATKMIGVTESNTFTILPSMAADVCFRDIGIRQLTRGAFRHEFTRWFMSLFPVEYMQGASFKGNAE